MESRIVLHVDMDYFYAQCEERENMELKGKAVVVCMFSRRGHDSGAVATCNYKARETGIKAGMPIVRAKKLNPEAAFLPANFELYTGVSDNVMDIIRGFSDRFEQAGIDEAFADVTEKVGGNFDKAKELALKLKETVLEKEKLTCSVGIASNKSVAKIASDFQKPNGLTLVKPNEIRGFLNPMPVRKLLGIGKKTEEELEELGIKTVNDLAEYKQEKLIEIFGRNKGMFLHFSALGEDDSPVEERGMSEQVGRMTTLEKDTHEERDIEPIIEELVLDVYEAIKQAKISFKTVTITAITNEFETHTKSHTLEEYSDKLEVIGNTARELLRLYLKQYPKKLRRLGIRVANLTQKHGQKTLGDFLPERRLK